MGLGMLGGGVPASKSTNGTARTLHLMWPDMNTIGGAYGNNGIPRNGAAAVAIASVVTGGTPPATTTPVYKGLRCWKQFSGAAGAATALWFTARFSPARDRMSYPTQLDDRAVCETRWLLAFDRPAIDLGDTLDLGVGVSPGDSHQAMNNAAGSAVYRAGVQFGPGGPGKLRFRSRALQSIIGPPAYFASFDTGNAAFAGFDEREWHWYAIRIVGGSSSSSGICKAFIDGVLFAQFDMSTVANLMPDPTGGWSTVGYQMGIINASNGTFDGMYVARGSLIVAPDEDSI